MKRFLAAAAILASGLISLAPGGDSAARGNASQADPGLSGFRSCKAFNRYAANHPRALRSLAWSFAPGVVLEDGGPTAGKAPAAPAPNSSTGTNVQEVGVDEPDIVKVAGSNLFALAKGQLHSVDLAGAGPQLLDSVELPGNAGGYHYDGTDLLISGDRALVISESGFGFFGVAASSKGIAPYSPQSTITELDISDPSDLRITTVMRLEGGYVSSRLTGSTARVVISATPDYPAGEDDQPAPRVSNRGRGEPIAQHGPRWLPTAVIKDRESGRKLARPLSPCTSVSRPESFSGLDTLTVLTIDLGRGLPAVDSDSIATSGQTIYGSTDALYVATENWYDGTKTPERLSDVSTEIHKFSATDAQTTDYAGSGEVPGFMLSQWSMSEHEGVLRVASTTSPPWREGGQSDKSQSFVTSLAAADGKLEPIGSLGGLGTDERIYAVRFIGDTGFVVTFREVDPLYALDLSDPTAPKVLGELKIPGYSAYLHPVGPGLLLGVGQAATDEGRVLGSQLSLFDVSDLADPKLIEQHRIGRNAYSEVEEDHHAFMFHPPAGLAVVPIDQWDPQTGESLFSGAIGFTVGAAGIDEAGRVSHEAGRYSAAVRRSLVVGDRLFTVSGHGVVVSDLTTLAPEGEARFPAAD